MADTQTPNLNLAKPEVGASPDTWGDKTNANWDKVDAAHVTRQPLNAGLTKLAGFTGNGAVVMFAGEYALDGSTHQPLDADLTAIAAISATSGLLRKTAANTWTLDTTDLAAKAPLANAALTGAPTTPQGAPYANTQLIANCAQVYSTVTTVPEAYSTTAKTLALTDAGKMVVLDSATPLVLTIPTAASVNFPMNTRIDILQLGAGQITVGGAGITIRSSGGKLKLSGQYSGATLWKMASDTWVLIGDIA